MISTTVDDLDCLDVLPVTGAFGNFCWRGTF